MYINGHPGIPVPIYQRYVIIKNSELRIVEICHIFTDFGKAQSAYKKALRSIQNSSF